MVDVILLLNIASVCFLVAELARLKRHIASRNDMASTSLEGIILHIVGNATIAFVGLLSGAYVTLVFEALLCIFGWASLYWKVRWLQQVHPCWLCHKWDYFGPIGNDGKHVRRCCLRIECIKTQRFVYVTPCKQKWRDDL